MKNKPIIWHRDDDSVVACTEKIKVMTENFAEIKQIRSRCVGRRSVDGSERGTDT